MEYEVRAMKVSDEVDSSGKKKGIIAGRFLDNIKHQGMIAPGMTIKVNGKNKRVRCVDILENKRIIIVEG